MVLEHGYTKDTVSRNTLFMTLLFPFRHGKTEILLLVVASPYFLEPFNYKSEPLITLWPNLKKSSRSIQVAFTNK